MSRAQKLNREWHRAHPMPRPASLTDRVRWHVAHAAACGCRPIPQSVARILAERRQRQVRKRGERQRERGDGDGG